MMLFFAVLLMVGAVTAIFFDVDTALWAGERTVDIWITVGLIITIVSPFIGIFQFVKSVVQKLYHLFHRRKA